MNAAKTTLVSTVVAAAFGLALGLSAVPSGSYACNTGVKHGGSAEGQPCGVAASGEVFPVKVTFDDVDGDSIQSDDGGPYIDGVADVAAEIPVEGTPPGELLVFLGGKDPRTFSFDLGLGCNFDGEPGVLDAGNVCVECPFDVDIEAPCVGNARGGLFARDPLEINGGVVTDLGYILTMPEGIGPQTRARTQEVEFRVGNTGWRIDFDDVTCSVEPPVANNFLDIVASDVLPAAPGLDDPTFREKWVISTDSGIGGKKRGCLSKTRGARNTILIGNFDLTFGYTVCILKPGTVDECFLE